MIYISLLRQAVRLLGWGIRPSQGLYHGRAITEGKGIGKSKVVPVLN
jgi:hypothetical protein